MEESTATQTEGRSVATTLRVFIGVFLALIAIEAGAFVFAPSLAGLVDKDDAQTNTQAGQQADQKTEEEEQQTNTAPAAANLQTNAANELLTESLTATLTNAFESSDFENSVNQFVLITCVIADDPALAEGFGVARKDLGAEAPQEDLSSANEECDQLFTAENLSAAKELAKIDDDNDKLNNLAEKVYHTNPDTADTDGDSYDDYMEVSNGYDPLTPSAP